MRMVEQSLTAAAASSFANDLRNTVGQWLPSALASATACWWLAANGYATSMLEWVMWLPIGLLLIPLGFTLGLACCVAVLTILLGMLCIPAWITGRPTGLAAVLTDAWRLATGVIPGFWRALRRVRRPALWGTPFGLFAGTVSQIAAST